MFTLRTCQFATLCAFFAALSLSSLVDGYRGMSGFTGAECLSGRMREVCKDNRQCYDTDSYLRGSNTRCSDTSVACACFPPQNNLKQCTESDKDCDKWERCMFTDLGPNGADLTNRLCMACFHIDLETFVGRRKIENVDNTPATCSKKPYGGLGNGNNNGDGDASGSQGESRPPDVSATPSFVSPPSITPFPREGKATITAASSQTGPPAEDPVCIDAKLLENSGHELIYKTHRMTTVLCDHMGSCATSGHIVVFKRQAMMMSKYCGLAKGGCMEKKMQVNSPRIGKKVRIQTFTDGLEMTALAARFSSSAEELVLKAMIHLGA